MTRIHYTPDSVRTSCGRPAASVGCLNPNEIDMWDVTDAISCRPCRRALIASAKADLITTEPEFVRPAVVDDRPTHWVKRDAIVTACGIATSDDVLVTTNATEDTCPACIATRHQDVPDTVMDRIIDRRESIARDRQDGLTVERRLDLIGDLADAHQRVIESQRQLERDLAEAKARGLSWSDVGAALNVTKQSAQARYKHLIRD